MARQQITAEPKHPMKLTVSKAEAAQNIKMQIDKGCEIRDTYSKEDLKRAQEAKYKWTKYNFELLVRLFDDDSIAKEYDDYTTRTCYVIPPSKRVEVFRQNMDDKITSLKSILERLELIPEDSPKNLPDIFEQNRRYVDMKLGVIVPKALEQFKTAQQRLSEENPEAGSQALLTCRRILESVADKLYPACEEPVIGSDGKERKLTRDKYINRLWQFVADRIKGSTTGDLLLTQIDDLGHRIDRVYHLASKGVHGDVSKDEVTLCVMQTYLLIGEILRLTDDV